MKVYLAGYNIDADVIEELKKSHSKRDDITPETLSAAYARISRDPRPINELRVDARKEVEKSRKSNETIIFGLGHNSVAEHAVFNFDIINVSRLAMEELEKCRLCSFTEKSQRYITLDSDYLIPEEIKNTKYEQEFVALIKRQNEMYHKLYDKLKDYVWQKHTEIAKQAKDKKSMQSLLESWAKEDARYITSLATYSQVGMTINARNLEKLLRRLSAHPLKELQDLGKELHSLVKELAPSIVKYPEAGDFDLKTYPEIKNICLVKYNNQNSKKNICKLIDYTKNGDNLILAALMFKSGYVSYQECIEVIEQMNETEKLELFKTAVKNMKAYDQVIREFEMAELTYEMVISAACFGQLKRHRMATIIAQDYNPDLGLEIPPAIKEINMTEEFEKITAASAKLYEKIELEYILTNAHQRRVLVKTNLRELYHMSRLREDEHAQWDIRDKTGQMVNEAKKVFPVCTSFIGGKDKFSELYQNLFQTVAKYV